MIKQEDDVGIFQLVLSEMSPGGIGLIEDLADEFALDPRMFFSVVSSVTAANEQELVDAQLREIISSCQEHDSVLLEDLMIFEMLPVLRKGRSAI